MVKTRQQRRRNRRQADPAVPPSPPTSEPIGPAGGDLGGTYPNPTVQSIANVTVGPIAGYPAGDAGNLTNLHSDQLNGALPALDASALLNVPAPPTLKSGFGTLDSNGQLDISGSTTAGVAIASWYNTFGGGQLYILGAPLRIASTSGFADAGFSVCWISF